MHSHNDSFWVKTKTIKEIKKEQKILEELIKAFESTINNSKFSMLKKSFALESTIHTKKTEIAKILRNIETKQNTLKNIIHNIAQWFYHAYQKTKDPESYRRYNSLKWNMERERLSIEKITKDFKEKFEKAIRNSR